ncbi:MAG: hypothetical protein HY902_20375 [Deltaproteobacteria bacterium]|nr:hypothetical protein [Deltaproteobacteria bacterium]
MYGILVIPPASDIQKAATVLAELAGGTAYDQRQKLLRNLPFLTAWSEQSVAVQRGANALREAGLQAWAISRAALDLLPDRIEVRSFARIAGGLELIGRTQSYRLKFEEIGLVLPCRADSGQTLTTTTVTRKVGLAQLAMGMPIPQKKVEVEQQKQFDQSFFCLLWPRRPGPDGDQLFELQAEGMDYGGLGGAKTASSTSNYLLLLDLLRQLAPSAWDPRLERAGGKLAPIGVPARTSSDGQGTKTTVTTSGSTWDTEDAVVQCAHLLLLAAKVRDARARQP